MSLEETPSTIWQIWMFHDFKVKDVSWKDTFHNPQNPIYIKNCGNDFKAKDVSLFDINSNFSNVYENCGKCIFKRHL